MSKGHGDDRRSMGCGQEAQEPARDRHTPSVVGHKSADIVRDQANQLIHGGSAYAKLAWRKPEPLEAPERSPHTTDIPQRRETLKFGVTGLSPSAP